MESQSKIFSGKEKGWLIGLRLVIGWHFLYEGFSKVLDPTWSASNYLKSAQGPLVSFFQTMAENPGMLSVVDFLNQWGLVLVGFGLVLGFLTRWAAYGGMLMLLFYYLSHPAILGISITPASTEGSYFLVDKLIIEFFALGVVALFPLSNYVGLDRFFNRKG